MEDLYQTERIHSVHSDITNSSSLHASICARLILRFIIGMAFAAGIVSGQNANTEAKVAPAKNAVAATAPADPKLEAAITAARDRAKLLHDVYTSTLDVMHHRYFRQDGPVLPARAMEDVFSEMADLSGDKANWIAVNTKAMSINHEPATPFEKKAASELSSGKSEYEQVENGLYQRATSIRLRTSCVGCHTKMFSDPPPTPRFAGLVISIQLNQEKK